MSTSLTRKELYNLVWSEPISVLSKKFNISDVGLAKVCKRANIPIPPRGYWNKVHAGKTVAKMLLPDRFFGQTEQVLIGGKYWESSEVILWDALPAFDETIETVIARAKLVLSKVVIPKTLSAPHPLIANLLAADEERKAKDSPYIWERPLFDSPVGKRRLRILNGIISALHQVGCRSNIRGKDAKEVLFTVGNQAVSMTLEPCIPKRTGARKDQALNDKHSVALKLEVAQHPDLPREFQNIWVDSEDKTLEEQLNDVVYGVLVLGEIQHRHNKIWAYEWALQCKLEDDARAQRKLEALEKARQEEVRLADEMKRTQLLGLVANWQTANNIRAFIAAMKNHPDMDKVGMRQIFGQWQEWALNEANKLDPLLAPVDKITEPIGNSPD